MNDLLDVTQAPLGWFARQLPLLLIAYAAPFLILAWWKRIYPNTPLLAALGVASALTLTLLLSDEMMLVVLTVDVVLAIFAAVDVMSLPARKAFQAGRETVRVASLQKNHHVTLTIANQSRRTHSIRVRDDVPQEFLPTPEEFPLRLGPLSRSVLSYEMKALRRGAFTLSHVFVKARSRWGFWRRHLEYPVESAIHVYPDLQQISQYAILARTNRLSLVGVRRTRKIGTDNEFERLRDYTLDDNYKHIDWRASARRNKLTVKDFQTSQSQRIIFLVDCGRMMTNQSNGITLLDHSLNAMLMLSFVALQQGDAVGMVCFSDSVHAYVPPQGGKNQMNRLLHTVFNRFPTLVESRYDQAFLYLNTHCKKRSLVVLVTNVIDEVNAFQIQSYLTNLVGRHLPLGVLLRDHRLFDVADAEPKTKEALYHSAAAAEILTWRHQLLTDLEHKGVLMLDLFPEDMTAPLVNSYLSIKARQML